VYVFPIVFLSQNKRSHAAVVSHTQAYPSSFQHIKSEPGFEQCTAQQIKTELTADYAGGYYAGDEDNSYDNYDDYYDETAGMYTDHGEMCSNSEPFADDATQVMEYSKPRAPKVELSLFALVSFV